MEQACLDSVALMWLTGRETPDHNTLWRFWNEHRVQLRDLLKESIKVAKDLGLVGMVLHAVDGTKIPAQAASRSGLHRRVLELSEKKIEESIQKMEDGLASSAAESEGYRLPPELADARKRKQQIEASLESLRKAGTNSLNPHDPDARMMKCSGRKCFGYNAQVVADEKTGIVVAADVVNGQTDCGLLGGMVDQVEETAGSRADLTLADKGYSSAEDLAAAEAKGHNVLVNLRKDVAPSVKHGQFHASRFTYDAERDRWVCPLGKDLKYQRMRKKRGKPVRVYHCTDYQRCPFRHDCSSNQRGRTIEACVHHASLERQRQHHLDPNAKQKLSRRAVIVEPVFAIVKDTMAFRRWTLRGLEGVRTQWSLLCTTVNLRKAFLVWRELVLATA